MTLLRKIGQARGPWDFYDGQLFYCSNNLAAYFTANGIAKPAESIKPNEPEPVSLDEIYEEQRQRNAEQHVFGQSLKGRSRRFAEAVQASGAYY